MFQKIIITLFLVLLLSGCATTTPTPQTQRQQLQEQINELQGKIYFLEQELQTKGREISELGSELESIKNIKQKTNNTPVKQLSYRQMQTTLKNAGFYKGPIDGKLGKQTKKAIVQFQKANGLKADGIIGEKTTAELSKYLN